MRPIVVSVVAALLAPAGAAAADAASTPPKPHCESRATGRDKLDVVCPLRANGAARRYRFKAHFSGSHDDTRLSMTVTLDGVPLACEPGSTTSLEGEDGDVSLRCNFSAAAEKAGTTRDLKVALSWWHALYTNYEFEAK